MNAVATAVLVELAKDFISLVREIAPNWASAYYRFRSGGARYGSNTSYLAESNVSIIGALRCGDFYERMNARGVELLEDLGKSRGVFVIIIDYEFNYDFKFEWDDLSRWEIAKLYGGTGLPSGI